MADEYKFEINYLWEGLYKLNKRVEELETRFNQLVYTEPVTEFHPGLYILRLTENDEMLCAADFNLPTKQVQFTIPEGYIVKEIVLKEKR